MRAKGQFHKFHLTGMVAVSALLVGLPSANAQNNLGQQTGIADPSRAVEGSTQPDLTPSVSPDIQVKAAPKQNIPAGAEKIRFTLQDIDFEGVSVYNEAVLRNIYDEHIGQQITLADLYGIANEVTMKYRNDGYILTQVVVPPQEISGGQARLQVVEGYVDRITLQKSDDSFPVNMRNIEAYAQQISRGGPLNARDLERELLIINDLPGVTARSVLSPSGSAVGAADMLIVVDYDPVDGLISLDNYGSRYLGPTQLGGAVTLNSMLGMNEAITAQAIIAPPYTNRELAYGSLSYEQPIGPYGTKLRLFTNATDTEPGWDIDQFDVRGNSWQIGAQATHPFIRSRSENLIGRLTLDWRKVRSANIIENTRHDRITSLRIGANYEFIDMLLGPAANTADIELSKGIGLFGTSDEGDADLTRAAGDPHYTKLEAEYQRLQRITPSVNLLGTVRGQIASDALLSSEEFGLGGITGGRGYDPSEVVGDHGIAATLELQWKEPVQFNSTFVDSYQVYTFYDVGTVWNEDATNSLQKRDSLASAGAGVRVDLPYDVEAGLAVAVPLTRRVQTKNDHDPEVYFNLSKKF